MKTHITYKFLLALTSICLLISIPSYASTIDQMKEKVAALTFEDVEQAKRNFLIDTYSQHPHFKNSAKEFKRKDNVATPFIIGGVRAPRNRFNEYTLIVIFNSLGEVSGACGGTMIAADKLLTAAHCSLERASRYLVVPGFYSFNDPLQNSDIFEISRVAAHPDFSNATFDNDVAVLTLRRDYSGPVSPVLKGDRTLVDENGTVIGTGLTSTSPTISPDTLRQVESQVTSNSSCNARWARFAGIRPITSNMLCAGFTTDARGSCIGDSGGPLYATLNSRRIVIGTVSFGFGQCELNRATQVYARMTSFTSFILSQSPTTRLIDPDQITIAPVIDLLLGGSSRPAPLPSGDTPPVTDGYPNLPPALPTGTDLTVVVVGDENDTVIGQTPQIFHLNATENSAQMDFQDIGLDEVNIFFQRPGSFDSYELWLRTQQATFPYPDLMARTYSPAAPIAAFADDTIPSASFSFNNGPCFNPGNGSFTIEHIRDNSSTAGLNEPVITEVRGRFEVTCQNNDSSIRGRFRYRR